MYNSEKIKELLTSIGYTLSDYGSEFRARPIYRDSDNNTVLRIKKSNGRWVDFKENISGNLLELVQISLNLSSMEDAKKYVEKQLPLSEIDTRITRPKISQPRTFSKDILFNLEKDNTYWNERGITDETLDVFGGGLCKSGRMAHRYIFPIFNKKNKLIGVSGRDVLKTESKRPKWKHLGDKHNWAYPALISEGFIASEKRAILVESIGDMLALWGAGIKNVLVVFGLNISSSITSLLLRLDPNEVILSFNNDSNKNFAGNRAADKAAGKLLKHFDKNQIRISLPTSNDFGDMSGSEINEWKEKHFGN